MDRFYSAFFYRLIILPIKAVLLFAVLLAGSACENDIEVIKAFSEDTLIPAQSMINAEIVYTDSAKLKVKITAPEIHNFSSGPEKYMEFPGGVFARFYDSHGNQESRLSSRYAVYYTEKELWEAKDNVEVVNLAGEILNTEQLFWDEKEKMIYSGSFVKITRPNEIITGEGFEADETFSRWKIRNIRATIYIDDE